MLKKSNAAKNAFLCVLRQQVSREIKYVYSEGKSSFLGARTTEENIKSFYWTHILDEIQRRAPFLYITLSAAFGISRKPNRLISFNFLTVHI